MSLISWLILIFAQLSVCLCIKGHTTLAQETCLSNLRLQDPVNVETKAKNNQEKDGKCQGHIFLLSGEWVFDGLPKFFTLPVWTKAHTPIR